MKRLFSIAIICCVLMVGTCLSTSPAFADEQIWTFDGNVTDWTVANGSWQVQDGVYKQTSRWGEAMHSLGGDTNWTDHTLEARVRLDEGNWAGVVFRARNEFEYYVYLLCPLENKSELWRHRRSRAFKDGFEGRDEIEHNIEPSTVTITRHEWFDLKVVVAGNSIQVSINGVQQGEFTDDAYATGKIGVWTWDTQASFDDLKVKGLKTTDTLTPVQPQAKLATTWASVKFK